MLLLWTLHSHAEIVKHFVLTEVADLLSFSSQVKKELYRLRPQTEREDNSKDYTDSDPRPPRSFPRPPQGHTDPPQEVPKRSPRGARKGPRDACTATSRPLGTLSKTAPRPHEPEHRPFCFLYKKNCGSKSAIRGANLMVQFMLFAYAKPRLWIKIRHPKSNFNGPIHVVFQYTQNGLWIKIRHPRCQVNGPMYGVFLYTSGVMAQHPPFGMPISWSNL